jgi:hypothetical protein
MIYSKLIEKKSLFHLHGMKNKNKNEAKIFCCEKKSKKVPFEN